MMERRFLAATEVRTLDPAGEGQPPRLEGYAAVFNSPTDFGAFQERVAPGAFRKSLEGGDIRALWNHDSNHPLGRTTAGTLRLSEDAKGLRFSVDLPETTMGRDARVSIQRGDVTGVSFGFTVPKGGDEWAMIGGKRTRTLLDVGLMEVSPVTFPAYQATQVEARSLDAIAAEGEARLTPEPDPLIAVADRQRRTRLAEIG